MVKISGFLKGKAIATKQAYTLLEMILVLSIVMILFWVCQTSSQKIGGSKEVSLSELKILIEKARFQAIQTHLPVTLSFKTHGVCLEGQCYMEEKISFVEPTNITFNENGNIQMGRRIDFELDHTSYQLVFNVGKGAYHIEKTSLYFTGCFVCLWHLFKCGFTFIQRYIAHRKSVFTKSGRDDGDGDEMARKQAFTLIESLLALVISMLIIMGFTTFLKGIKQLHFKTEMQDLCGAIVGISEEVNLAQKVEVRNDSLVLYTTDGLFELSYHQGRLVKTPGFNIYLHNLDDISFEIEHQRVYMMIQRGDNYGRFQIGTSYRPTPRICKSVGTDDGDDFNGSDSADFGNDYRE